MSNVEKKPPASPATIADAAHAVFDELEWSTSFFIWLPAGGYEELLELAKDLSAIARGGWDGNG